MGAELTAAPPAAAPRGAPFLSRVYGFGSVYAKTLRDSRLSFIILSGLFGGLMLVAGAGVGSVYKTAQSRHDLAKLATDLTSQSPVLAGITGNPVNVGTIGGYVNWKYGPVFVYVACLWLIFVLSGTLAAEARRGSLDMVAASPFGRRRLAVEKLAAHLTVLAGAVAVLGLATWVAGAAFASVPGDRIPPEAAAGYALWLGLVALASGTVAFAVAPFLGRGAAAWIAGFVLFAGWLLNGYQAVVPALAGTAKLTWFSWTAKHVPLAGLYDWGSLLPVAVVSVVLLATPLARARWAVSGAVGVYLAIAAMTVVLAAGVGIGALAAGSDAATPMLGSITLGLYAAAVAGFGFAVGGLFRTSIAAEVVALVVVATFLIDLIAPALKLPDWVHQLALTAHLGQPMVGVWDGAGIAACLVLAAGGAALGGWGMRRRDVAR